MVAAGNFFHSLSLSALVITQKYMYLYIFFSCTEKLLGGGIEVEEAWCSITGL